MYVVVLFHALGDNENTKKFTSPVQMQVFPPNMFDPLLVGVMDMGPQDRLLTNRVKPATEWVICKHSLIENPCSSYWEKLMNWTRFCLFVTG